MNRNDGINYRAPNPAASPDQRLDADQLRQVNEALGNLEASEDPEWNDLYFLRQAGSGAPLYQEQLPRLRDLLAKWGGAR